MTAPKPPPPPNSGKRGMSILTGNLRSISPSRPPIVVGATLPTIMADYLAAATSASPAHTPTDLASALYHSSTPYPLPQWLDHWKAGRLDVMPSNHIIQLCFAYRLLVEKYGPRKVDDGNPFIE